MVPPMVSSVGSSYDLFRWFHRCSSEQLLKGLSQRSLRSSLSMVSQMVSSDGSSDTRDPRVPKKDIF
jgi:hypothetical protein